MELLEEGQWDYMLFAHEGRLLLDVVCGTVGIFTVAIELNEAERGLWEAGELASVVEAVRWDPGKFSGRRVELPPFVR
jgi:hypothetical protein